MTYKIVDGDVIGLKDSLKMSIEFRFEYVDKSKFLRAATYLDWRYKNFEFICKDNKVKKCPREVNLNKARQYLEVNCLKILARQVGVATLPLFSDII